MKISKSIFISLLCISIIHPYAEANYIPSSQHQLRPAAYIDSSRKPGDEDDAYAPMPEVPYLENVIRRQFSYSVLGDSVDSLGIHPVANIIIFGIFDGDKKKYSDIVAYKLPEGELAELPEWFKIAVIEGDNDFEQLVFNNDGNRVCIRKMGPHATRQLVSTYEWSTGRKIGKTIVLGKIRGKQALEWRDMAVSGNGKTIYTVFSPLFNALGNSFIHLYDVKTGQRIGKKIDIPLRGKEYVLGILANPDGHRLHLYVSYGMLISMGKGYFRTYDMNSNVWADKEIEIPTPSYSPRNTKGWVLSADGSTVYVGELGTPSITAYSVSSGEKSNPLYPELFPCSLGINSEGRLIVVYNRTRGPSYIVTEEIEIQVDWSDPPRQLRPVIGEAFTQDQVLAMSQI